MILRHLFTRLFVVFVVLNSSLLQAQQASQSTQTAINFSSKSRVLTLEDLSIHTMLAIIHDNINQALKNLTNNQDTSSTPDVDLDTVQKQEQQKQVLITLQKFFDETTSLLTYIVHNVINTGVFKYNPDVEYKFINTYNCINLTEPVQPRHLRLLKNNIEDLNRYIAGYCLTRKNYLPEQETTAFAAITKLNNSMLDCILKDEFMGIDYWDRLADNCFYRPLEWVCANKRLVIFVSAVTIGLILYYYLVICKENKKEKELENKNKKFDVVQFKVIDQDNNVCAYHSFYNVGILLADDDIAILRNNLQDKKRLERILPKDRRNDELDAQDVEEQLIRKNPLNFSDHIINKMVVIPSIDPLENTFDRDELIAHLDEAIPGRNFVHQLINFRNGKKGEKIGFLINTGNQGERNGDLIDTTERISHWFGAVFTKDPNAKHGISIAVADSLGNKNITNDRSINLIAEKLLQ